MLTFEELEKEAADYADHDLKVVKRLQEIVIAFIAATQWPAHHWWFDALSVDEENPGVLRLINPNFAADRSQGTSCRLVLRVAAVEIAIHLAIDVEKEVLWFHTRDLATGGQRLPANATTDLPAICDRIANAVRENLQYRLR